MLHTAEAVGAKILRFLNLHILHDFVIICSPVTSQTVSGLFMFEVTIFHSIDRYILLGYLAPLHP